ncbi:MAG: site-specific integrase [Planctomycetota bacterium]
MPGRRFPAEVYTDAEVRRVLAAVPPPAAYQARTRALVAVLYRSGLRLGEALDLRPPDVDAAAGAVRVLRGKGGRPRTAGMDAGAFEYLDSWLRHRRAFGRVETEPLFCTAEGSPIFPSTVRRALARLGRRAGLAKRLHAHGLRHTHAAQLRAEGVDIAIISRQLGHASLLTTVIYLDHLHPSSVLEAVGGRDWRP